MDCGARDLNGNGWIADVLVSRGDVRVVFEVQWSRQDEHDFRSRQRRYIADSIASVAWFSRHIDGLPQADRALPVFGLQFDDPTAGPNESAIEPGVTTPVPLITVDDKKLSLAEVVTRLLTRGIQHRDYVHSGTAGSAHLTVTSTGCWKCGRRFGIWNLDKTTVTGPCGRVATRYRDVEQFPLTRPESDPPIQQAAAAASRSLGVAPGFLAKRTTKASGTTYLAFCCPHCRVVSGEVFVQDEFRSPSAATLTVDVPVAPTPVSRPHWCVASSDGLCLRPSAEEQAALEAAEHEAAARELDGRRAWETETDAAVTVAPVLFNGSASPGSTIARMFAGSRFPHDRR